MPYVAHNTIQNHPAFLVNFYLKFKNQYLIFFEIIFVNQKQKLSYLCISHISLDFFLIIVIHLATKISDIKLEIFLMAITTIEWTFFYINHRSRSYHHGKPILKHFCIALVKNYTDFDLYFRYHTWNAQMLTLFCVMIVRKNNSKSSLLFTREINCWPNGVCVEIL